MVERINAYQPAIIFMDNWLPDEGSIVATRLIKNTPELRQIPVVYFSANSEIQELMGEAGADAYLSKTFDLVDLEQVIKRALTISA